MEEWVANKFNSQSAPLRDAEADDDEQWYDEDSLIPSYKSRDLDRFSFPVTPETEKQVFALRHHMYRKANDLKKLK